MANTYTLIASNVLASSASGVTFNSIPQNYTDLVLKASVGPEGFYNASFNQYVRLWISVNASVTSGITGTYMAGNGSVGSSARETETQWWQAGIFTENNGNSASVFSSIEAYIPNYAGSTYKLISVNSAQEGNTIDTIYTRLGTYAGLYSNTAAITSLRLLATYANWPAGSSFYLYGIKKS